MPRVIYVERKRETGCVAWLALFMVLGFFLLLSLAIARTAWNSREDDEKVVVKNTSVQLFEKWFDKDGNPTLIYISKIGNAKKSYDDFYSECLYETVKHTETPFIGAALFDRKEDVIPPRGLVASGAYFTLEKDAKQPYAEYVGNPRNGSKEFQVNK
jgi:predicted permease